MKKLFISVILFYSFQSFGQLVTRMPEIDDQTSPETDITRIELTSTYTIVSFSYQVSEQKSRNYNFQFPFPVPRQQERSTYTISINPKSYLSGNGKRFKYIKSTGIPELPEDKIVLPGERYRFTVYYERLEPGIEQFNLIEGKNSPENRLQFWNFYGVHINNPLKKQAQTPPPVASEKPAPKKTEAVDITVKGKIFDAKTNLPIVGKVVYQNDKSNKAIDSLKSSSTGDYLFMISPNSYSIIASADGYESTRESLDLSKISRNQQFTKNIYLDPIVKKADPKAVPPKVIPPKPEVPAKPKEEDAPIKIEENKFRLDKVYFKIGESGLLPESFEQLNGLLKMLKESPKMTILVEGHTDNVGDPTLNKRLSLERAFNVREYLISKGIAGNRIQFKGYGDTKPVSTNETEEGRKINRRVEFVIINP